MFFGISFVLVGHFSILTTIKFLKYFNYINQFYYKGHKTFNRKPRQQLISECLQNTCSGYLTGNRLSTLYILTFSLSNIESHFIAFYCILRQRRMTSFKFSAVFYPSEYLSKILISVICISRVNCILFANKRFFISLCDQADI